MKEAIRRLSFLTALFPLFCFMGELPASADNHENSGEVVRQRLEWFNAQWNDIRPRTNEGMRTKPVSSGIVSESGQGAASNPGDITTPQKETADGNALAVETDQGEMTESIPSTDGASASRLEEATIQGKDHDGSPSMEGASRESDNDATTPEEKKPPLQEQVNEFVLLWKKAWEGSAGTGGDFDGYAAFYSDAFTSEGMKKALWAQAKKKTNKKKEWIAIDINDVKVEAGKNTDEATVTFLQRYRSSNYQENWYRKVLQLTKKYDQWKIIAER